MIKENQRLLNQLHIFSDAALIFLSMLAAYGIRFRLFHGIESFPFINYVWLGLAAVVICLLSYAIVGLYESHRAIYFYREAARFLAVNALDTVVLTAGVFILHLNDISRWTLAIFFLVSSCLLLGKRAGLRMLLRVYRQRGYNQKHILLVGGGPAASVYLEKVRNNPELGYQVIGYVAAAGHWDALPYCGPYQDLEGILERLNPEEVVVTVPPEDEEQMPLIISACEKAGVKVSVVPFYIAYLPSNPQVDSIDGLPLINLRRIPLDNIGNAFLKRALDVAGAVVLLALTSPLLLAAAIGVRLSSPGPVIFKQERVGKNKKNFYMYKFRSMRVNAAEQTGWTTNQDSRKTKFGSFIRKCSLDELPQLVNVLKGDMSLVGPRPEVPFYVEQFKEEIPRYMVKHQARPGITGWAQVNGFRGDTSIKGRIEHDLYYIENWNILFDCKILFLTIFSLVNRETLKTSSD